MNIQLLAPLALVLSMSSVGLEGAKVVVREISERTITGHATYARPVRAGDTVLVSWIIDKRRECPGESGRVWAGVEGFHLSEVHRPTGLNKTDGPQEFMIPTAIPETAPVGELSMKIVGHFDCPNEQREHFTLGPVEFLVLP